ncbi:MAG: TlpA family protein disulfide reductase [Acidobacteriota bacterium]|nr:TlpA family protein disulfide reductase [Acidobacteriota bacterium]
MSASRIIHCAVLLAALVPAAASQGAGAPKDVSVVTVSGERISLGDGSGPTELVFVASWCLPCERAMTGVRRRLGAHRRQGYRVVLVGVSGRQTEEQFTAWAEKFGFKGPLVYDRDGELERIFRAQLLPWHVVVGRDGKLVHQKDEPPGTEELRSWVTR